MYDEDERLRDASSESDREEPGSAEERDAGKEQASREMPRENAGARPESLNRRTVTG